MAPGCGLKRLLRGLSPNRNASMSPLPEPSQSPIQTGMAPWRGSPKASVSRDEGPGEARSRGTCNGPNLGTPRVRAPTVLWGFSESFPEKKLLMAFQVLYRGTRSPGAGGRGYRNTQQGFLGPGGLLWNSDCSPPACYHG